MEGSSSLLQCSQYALPYSRAQGEPTFLSKFSWNSTSITLSMSFRNRKRALVFGLRKKILALLLPALAIDWRIFSTTLWGFFAGATTMFFPRTSSKSHNFFTLSWAKCHTKVLTFLCLDALVYSRKNRFICFFWLVHPAVSAR